MLYRRHLLDIIDYAFDQARDSYICVCPSAVPDWDDNHITDSMFERQLKCLRLIRDYVKKQKDEVLFTTDITTSYIPSEDITVIWQHMYIDGDYAQRACIGWYCGEPDDKATKMFSSMPLIGQYGC